MALENLTYLILNLVCYLLPFIYVKTHTRVTNRLSYYFINKSVLISSLLFIFWDLVAVHYRHWSFNPRYITGIFIGPLPIEEILFLILIPQSCLLLWVALGYVSTHPISTIISNHKRRLSRIFLNLKTDN